MGSSVSTTKTKSALLLAQSGFKAPKLGKENELTLEITKHPLFFWRDDDILSLVVQASEILINPGPSFESLNLILLFKGYLDSLVFQTKDLKELEQSKVSDKFQKTVCGKHLTMNDLYFRCFDCDLESTPGMHSLQCLECFEKSDHENHRVLLVKKENPGAATCDCGCPEIFKAEGFCPDHKPQEIDIKQILQEFPAILAERYKLVLKKLLYSIVCLVELGSSFYPSPAFQVLTTIATILLEEVLNFCESSYNEKNGSFRLILGQILQETFLSPYNKLWHTCDDTTGDSEASSLSIRNPHNCTCSILVNLMRIIQRMGTTQQSKLEKILIECSSDPNFKHLLTIEFARNIQYLFCSEFDGTSTFEVDNLNSQLLNMYAQIFIKEETLMETIKLGCFENYIRVMKIAIEKPNKLVTETYHALSHLRLIMTSYFRRNIKSVCDTLIKEMDISGRLLEPLEELEKKFYYEKEINIDIHDHDIDYMAINLSFLVERVANQPLENCIALISQYPEDQKWVLVKRFVPQWYKRFQNTVDANNIKLECLTPTFIASLERIFTWLTISVLGENITQIALEKFFKDTLPDIEVTQIAENVSESILRILGLVRFIHIIHNFDGGPIYSIYYFLGNVFFETDIVAIQNMSMIIKPERLFEHLIKNFFSYCPELQKFFENPLSLKSDDHFK